MTRKPMIKTTAQSFAVEFSLSSASSNLQDLKLYKFLENNTANAVRISAAGLQKIDSLLLQLLLSAAKAWSERGLGFELTEVPAEFESCFTLLGLRPEMITWKFAQ